MAFNFTDYKLLSFDIYGTLIDWDTGIYNGLSPLIDRLPEDSPYRKATKGESRQAILRAFSVHGLSIQTSQPKLLYSKVLAVAYGALASELGVKASDSEAEAFGGSVSTWKPFADTVEAMKVLGSHYKLVALSNVDRASFLGALSGPLNGVRFDGIYTAEDIGSYKPSLNNFQYLVDHVNNDFGVKKEEILHVAQSLFHDHVPGKEFGLRPGIWINRKAGEEGQGSGMGGSLKELEAEGKIKLAGIYKTLGELSGDVQKAFAAN